MFKSCILILTESQFHKHKKLKFTSNQRSIKFDATSKRNSTPLWTGKHSSIGFNARLRSNNLVRIPTLLGKTWKIIRLQNFFFSFFQIRFLENSNNSTVIYYRESHLENSQSPFVLKTAVFTIFSLWKQVLSRNLSRLSQADISWSTLFS